MASHADIIPSEKDSYKRVAIQCNIDTGELSTWLESALSKQSYEVQRLVGETVAHLLNEQRHALVAELNNKLGSSSVLEKHVSDSVNHAVPAERQNCARNVATDSGGSDNLTDDLLAVPVVVVGTPTTNQRIPDTNMMPKATDNTDSAIYSTLSAAEEKRRGHERKMPKRVVKTDQSDEQRIKVEAFLTAKGWHTQPLKESIAMMSMSSFSGCSLAKIVRSASFDFFFGCMIILNAVVIAVQAEHQGLHAEVVLHNLDQKEHAWVGAGPIFEGLEMFFKLVFLIELLLRLKVDGLRFFREHWMNGLDVLVVATSTLSLFSSDAGMDFTFLRILRLVKLLRILRMVRVMKMFSQLRILVGAIASSFGACGWSLCLIAIVQMMAGLVLTQQLHDFIMDDSNDLDTRKWCFRYFGTFFRSWISMFEITGGNWGVVGRPLIEKVNQHYFWFFIMYVGIVSFAFLRVVAALFLRQTLASATRDEEMIAEDKMKHIRSTQMQELKIVFEQAVSSLDGTVSWSEFEKILKDPKVAACLKHFDLVPDQALSLFHLLDNGDDRVSFDEFSAGLMRIKGPGKQVDVVTILYENQKIHTHLNQLKQQITQLRESLPTVVNL